MKVLWLSSANILADEKKGSGYNGKGWIGSLLDAVREFAPGVHTDIAFIGSGNSDVTTRNGVTFHSIGSRKPEGLKKLVFNWTGKPEEVYDDNILDIVERSQPDLVHIFGAESKLASGLTCINGIPVILHIQGILNECTGLFFPEDIKRSDFMDNASFFNEMILRNGYLHLYEDFRRRAEKEKKYLSATRFAMGRTEWDKAVLGKFSNAEYFHVDEVLRPEFYANAGTWKYRKYGKNKIQLISTISEMPYKGIDVILKTASILKSKGLEFEWNVAGVREKSDLVRIFEKKYGISGKESGVNFTGIKTPDEIVGMITGSDIYIHPSYIENSPNSLCEAQMTGIPAIAADTGGIPSIAGYGKASLLYPNGDAAALAGSIYQLSSNPEYAEQIGKRGQNIAAKRHDKRHIVSDLLAAYEMARKLY